MSNSDIGRREVLQKLAVGGLGAGLVTATFGAPASAGPRPRSSGSRSGPTIAILLYDGLTALDAVGPYEILCRIPGAEVFTMAKRPGRLLTDTGAMSLFADRPLRDVRHVDVLVVPGAGERWVTAAMEDAEILESVRRLHRRTQWTTSVCVGSLILGAAGLLRGVPATTYWASRAYLESHFGAVYTPGRFVQSGKIITAAGVSAGIDMALLLATKIAGERVAQALQLAVEYDPDPPFDTGSPEKAGPELQQLALELLAAADR